MKLQHPCWKLFHTESIKWSEPRHDKANKMSVRPAKNKISLGIRPVWWESSQCAQWVAKDLSFLHADSEDSDQTGRMPRLIWVFAGHTAILLVLLCRGSSEKLQSDKFDLRKKGKLYRMLICTELVLLTITAITSALWRIKAFRTVGTLNLSEYIDTKEVLCSLKSSSLLVIKCVEWPFASTVNRQEPIMIKHVYALCETTKKQISLCIRTVWAASLLFAP